MGVVGDDLVGPEVEVTVDTLVDGGTWIRPLRGDMLRTPESEPQVSRGPYSLVHFGKLYSCQTQSTLTNIALQGKLDF